MTCWVLLACAADGDRTGVTSAAESSCGEQPAVAGRPLRAVTTVAPLTNIVANIAAGTDIEVVGIVPEGTNSHTFHPTPSDATALSRADVVFVNGLALEEPTRELARATAAANAEICELGSEVLAERDWIYDASFPKDGGKPNPHLWTSPPLAREYARVVRDALIARDPANAATYRRNDEAFSSRAAALDSAMVAATASVPADQRKLLTYHDAFAYVARRYGWTVIGAIQPSTFVEPTPRDVADLITQIKAERVRAIFGSEVFPSPVLEQIGRESGARYVDVLRDDDLPGEPGGAEHSWLGLMRFDFVTMVEALGGDATALRAIDVSDVGPADATYPQ